MYPVLFRWGTFAIYTYGLFVAIGFLAGILVSKHEARRTGEDPEKITDLIFFILLGSILGARIFYVFTAPSAFVKDPLEFFRLWNGGLVFYGGFIGALITGVIYLKRHKMPFWKSFDLLIPGLALGHFFGRIGCLFAGCCYGQQCHLPWAITFTHPESLAPTGVPLHPTQLYSALSNLAIFGVLWYFKKFKTFHGQLFCLYVLIYAVARSVIESFRGDFRGGFFLEIFSVSQVIGGIFAGIAVILWFVLKDRTRLGPHD